MGLSSGIGSLISSGVQGAASIWGGMTKANAAQQAAAAQVSASNQGLGAINSITNDQKANLSPFINGGTNSLQSLLAGFDSGHFGTGSTGTAPVFEGGTFQAPSLDEARATPGYQFAQTQGTNSILKGAAAAGGSITGGTLKSLASFGTGLADSTYGNRYNQALSTYGAGLQKYQADLSGYAAKNAGNQQEYNQLAGTATMGENAAQALSGDEGAQGKNISDLYTGIGNANAAGIIGSTNQTTGGIQSGLAQGLQGMGGGGYGSPGGGYGQQPGGGGFGGGTLGGLFGNNGTYNNGGGYSMGGGGGGPLGIMGALPAGMGGGNLANMFGRGGLFGSGGGFGPSGGMGMGMGMGIP